MLTRKQVLYGLERVELRTSSIFDECPLDLNNKKSRQNLCSGFSLLFRTPSGQCNNLKQPSWGSSFIPFLRFLPPDYRYKIFKMKSITFSFLLEINYLKTSMKYLESKRSH